MLAAALVVLQIVVRPGTPVPTLEAALQRAHPGDTITLTAGTYPTNSATVRTPRLLIRGEGWPVLDGEGTHEILVIAAAGVRVEGILFRGAGVNMTRDQAAVKVIETGGCRISGNRFEGNFFSIYLQRAHDCLVRGNSIHGTGRDEAQNGNGIHLWNATGVVVDSNTIDGHRDGIYLEFARDVRATGNRSGHNRRYGLHFMFSNDCSYRDNAFDGNGAGVAVMYSRAVTLAGNLFTHASGPSAYGLLLKEIRDSHVDRNRFVGNTVALYMEGASRNSFLENDFRDNGWGVRLLASSEMNTFAGNLFAGNSFDVTTNGRSNTNTFRGNRWDRYDGYDLDRDGVGDVPFRPVRRFALLVEQHESAILLLRSPFADLLDLAEAVFPVLTPETLVDARPVAQRGR